MDGLVRRRVSEIIIVVGYCKDVIINHFGSSYRGIKIRYVANEDYATTNNIYSLKLGLAHVTEDLILCEGDVVVQPDLFDVIDKRPHENLVFVGKHESYMTGTIIKLDKEMKRVSEMVMGASQAENYDYSDAYKTINMYYLSYDFLKRYFIPTLNLYLSNHPTSGYYEIIIGVLLYMGTKQLFVVIVDNTQWFEIDDEADLDMAEYLFSKNKLEMISRFHGGYWRYGFLDFCYLFNQHFPSEAFFAKLAAFLPNLVNHYPSGHSRLCKMLSRWYSEDSFNQDNLIIGNGASELIRIINTHMVHKVTIPIPTFNEYENKLENHKINYFVLNADKGFRLIKEDFVASVRDSKSDVALIINPNNPTGSITSKEDILWILKQLTDAIVIVDESFIDFSGDRASYSVQSLVEDYASLVVIRSISKEFGVPGLRLGYVVTTNRRVKHTILKHVPIWNVNSLAEYFIENFPRYRDSYDKSICQVIEDRESLYGDLKRITYLEPLPSHANFILCKVMHRSAQSLTKQLFEDFRILIKDCANKRPISEDNYVRIAVRTKEENKMLIDALGAIDT
jgi:histidinol-phosphate/aromatic aminotransferase/cobyric acid decarboxylase-like protein/choline kinase